jgi:hypothetical protein
MAKRRKPPVGMVFTMIPHPVSKSSLSLTPKTAANLTKPKMSNNDWQESKREISRTMDKQKKEAARRSHGLGRVKFPEALLQGNGIVTPSVMAKRQKARANQQKARVQKNLSFKKRRSS